MDALRIILIILGAGIIFGIYVYSRARPDSQQNTTRKTSLVGVITRLRHFLSNISFPAINQKPDSAPQQNHLHYAALDDECINNLAGLVASKGEDDTTETESVSSINTIDATEINAQTGEEFLLVLNIKPRAGQAFTGEQILQATRAAGMQFGEHDIFHRHVIVHERVVKIPVCSLANMFEPGTFDFSDVSNVTVPGLVMFMQLPGPVDAEAAFENTLRTAQKLALELDARLCDDSHSILTAQTIEHIKEKMKAYHFRQRIQASQQH